MKKDGSEQDFDRNKLRIGIEKAWEKRDVPMEVIEGVVNDIEMRLRRRSSVKIKSTIVGDMVMNKLRKIDKVAYMRFASVYRDFDDLKSFEEELRILKR